MMIWAFKQLGTPCKYLMIRHGDGLFRSKVSYDFVLPAIFAAVTFGVATGFDMPLDILGNDSLFSATSGLLAILIGFYMAALAAVATFDRAGIDNKLEGEDALLSVRNKDGQGRTDKKLSYRQFISYLFGYASFLSFILYTTLLLAKSIWPNASQVALSYEGGRAFMAHIVEPVSFFLIFFFLWQLFLVSLLGIYFLAERVQELHET